MGNIGLNMNKFICLIIFAVCGVVCVSAGDIYTVEGSSVYNFPENETLVEAKVKAAQIAKLEAMARKFGTSVASVKILYQDIINGKSESEFTSLSRTEVKGEWIETIGEPIYALSCVDNKIKIKVTIKGKVRKIINENIDISARILRNGTNDSAEDTHFNSGDILYVSFVSPMDGYVSVFYEDKDKNVYCLLPNIDIEKEPIKVKADKRYVFFSSDEYQFNITCGDKIEHNRIYILYSPNRFTLPIINDEQISDFKFISYMEFQNWLVDRRVDDRMMKEISKDIIINPTK